MPLPRWKRLAIAAFLSPLVIPAIVFVISVFQGNERSNAAGTTISGALVYAVIIGVLSYCSTLFIGLPLLFIASLWTRINTFTSAICGVLAGLIATLPISFVMYRSSGADSGPPPPISILEFLDFAFLDWTSIICVASGVVTSLAFYFISGLRKAKIGNTVIQ